MASEICGRECFNVDRENSSGGISTMANEQIAGHVHDNVIIDELTRYDMEIINNLWQEVINTPAHQLYSDLIVYGRSMTIVEPPNEPIEHEIKRGNPWAQ